MTRLQTASCALFTALCCSVVLVPTGRAQDDTDLLAKADRPNIMLLIDNSASMAEIVPHPDYDADRIFSTTECGATVNTNEPARVPPTAVNFSKEYCLGDSLTVYPDRRIDVTTVYPFHYLVWLTLDASMAIKQDLKSYDNGSYATQCEKEWSGQDTYSLYIRSRLTWVKDILATVLCTQKNKGALRMGLAAFRRGAPVESVFQIPGGSTVPVTAGATQGGYVLVPIDDITSTGNHFDRFAAAVNALQPSTATPLSETFFHLYQYFMSRDPTQTLVVNGERFPPYTFSNRPGNGSPATAPVPAKAAIPGTPAVPETSTTPAIPAVPAIPATPAVPAHIPDGVADGTDVPADPVPADCLKSSILILTDGFPERDSFRVPDLPSVDLVDLAAAIANEQSKAAADQRPTYIALLRQIQEQVRGWDRISSLIPDAPDYPSELHDCRTTSNAFGTNRCYLRSGSGPAGQYDILLDDIAALMATEDFRPDIPGTQTITTHTVAFAAGEDANRLLTHTAQVGGGSANTPSNPNEIRESLLRVFAGFGTDAQSFTTPLVRGVIREIGASLFLPFFRPNDTAFWEGHLEHRTLSVGPDTNGDIVDTVSPPHWDAGAVLQSRASNSRDLRVSVLETTLVNGVPTTKSLAPNSALPQLRPLTPSGGIAVDAVFPVDAHNGFGASTTTPPFDHTKRDEVFEAALGVMRGCVYPTSGSNCDRRTPVLGDIFHSRPVLVGPPRYFSIEPSYRAYQQQNQQRDRRLYVGANDGFLHSFDAGEWDAAANAYTVGSGAERFGFMPWPVRRAIPDFVRDISNDLPRRVFSVDASPSTSDAWLYSNPKIREKVAAEWRTVLIGGLRRGGNAYYALDVTRAKNPDNYGSAMQYLWEFPKEEDLGHPTRARPIGQTWGRPIITKVQVHYEGEPHERWVAILTGGYDPAGDPNHTAYDPASEVGRGIYLIDITNGEILGEKRMRAPDPPTAEVPADDPRRDMLYAIPSAAAVFDTNSDDYADVIYVGDLGGNIWKWVIGYRAQDGHYLTDAVNDSTQKPSQPDTTFHLFFSAKKNAAANLGVTHEGIDYFHSFFFPAVGVLHRGQLRLAFASGERAHLRRPAGPVDNPAQDATLQDNNRFYSVNDPRPFDTRPATASTPTEPVPPEAVTEADLADVSVATTATAAATTSCPANFSTQSGYYFRAENGEKFSTEILLARFHVAVGSYVSRPLPPGSLGATLCGQNRNRGNLYYFELACGKGLNSMMVATETHGGRRATTGGGVPNAPRRSVLLPKGSSRIYHNTSDDRSLQGAAGPNYNPGGGQLYWLRPENRTGPQPASGTVPPPPPGS